MAEERRQNIFITLATNGVILRKKNYDLRLTYPFCPENVSGQDGIVPIDIMISLGNNAIDLEECENCIDNICSGLKSLGCKMTPDRDLNYCAFKVVGEEDEVMAQCVVSHTIKGQ